MEQTHRVMVLGDLNVDLGLDMPSFPAPGGDGVASRQRLGFGGSAANTALMLHRLGLPAAMLSCVGTDLWGDYAVAQLEAEGVDVSHIMRDALAPTSLNIVAVTPDGERTMLAYRGASSEYQANSLPLERVDSASHLHVSGYALLSDPQRTSAILAATAIRAAGGTVSLDVPVDPAVSAPAALHSFMPLVDILVVGSAEARTLTGMGGDAAAASAFRAAGVSLVAIKLGSEGSLLGRDELLVHVPAPDVDVIDSTGAGDSFCAGLIAAILAGETDLTAAGAFANSCGAAAVSRVGAGASLPALQDVMRVVRSLPSSMNLHHMDSLFTGSTGSECVPSSKE